MLSNTIRFRPLLAVLLTVVMTLAVAGCSNSNSADKADEHNPQDIAFVEEMIPHHAQAVAMSRLAASQGASNEVKDLATRIERAQQPEIDQMNSWLKDWRKEGISATDDMANNESHEGHGGDHGKTGEGMLSNDEMVKLGTAQGADFDKLYLEGMIKHHEGAVVSAKKQQSEGKFPATKALADSIVSSQQAEIVEMQQLLS